MLACSACHSGCGEWGVSSAVRPRDWLMIIRSESMTALDHLTGCTMHSRHCLATLTTLSPRFTLALSA